MEYMKLIPWLTVFVIFGAAFYFVPKPKKDAEGNYLPEEIKWAGPTT